MVWFELQRKLTQQWEAVYIGKRHECYAKLGVFRNYHKGLRVVRFEGKVEYEEEDRGPFSKKFSDAHVYINDTIGDKPFWRLTPTT